MNYLCFIDESGNNNKERFFGLGVLMVPVDIVGRVYTCLQKHRSRIQSRSHQKTIARGLLPNKHNFELKFSHINFDNEDIYCKLLSDYFTFQSLRSCSLVIDKNTEGTSEAHSHLDMYLQKISFLLRHNFEKLDDSNKYMIFGDDMTQPKGDDSYEDVLWENLLRQGIIPEKIFGVSRIESHASIFIQMTDILLGCVMHCFENKEIKKRKVKVIQEVRKNIGGLHPLNDSVECDIKNHFSIWKYTK